MRLPFLRFQICITPAQNETLNGEGSETSDDINEDYTNVIKESPGNYSIDRTQLIRIITNLAKKCN
jgi:hypothetical protein